MVLVASVDVDDRVAYLAFKGHQQIDVVEGWTVERIVHWSDGVSEWVTRENKASNVGNRR